MADEQPADDLRSLLSASFDQAATPAAEDSTPAPKAEAAVEKPSADIEPKATDDRPRGADGKFLKKEDQDADDVAKAKEADKEASDSKKTDKKADESKADDAKSAAEPDDKAKEEPKADGKEAPANWSASDKAMFNLQSPEAKEFLLRRHRQMQGEFDRKSGEIAGLKKEFGPIEEMFRPHLEVMKAKGLTPAATIRGWANIETALANGRGIDVIDGMIKGYNIDKAQLARKLGFTSSPAQAGSTDATTQDPAQQPANDGSPSPINLPPQVAEELRQLREGLNAIRQADQTAKLSAAQEREAKAETEITNFKTAANGNGDLLHPYFDEVEPAMLALARSYAASGQAMPPLAELYETAVWANPSTRQALLATQKVAEQTKAAEEARAKAASARKAASSVTGAPGSGQATRQVHSELSLREQLEEAAADTAA